MTSPHRHGPYDTYDDHVVKNHRPGRDYAAIRRDTGCPTLALVIRKRRKALGLTQVELAKVLGVSRSRLAQWETAKIGVTTRDYGGVSKALGLHGLKVEYRYSEHHCRDVVKVQPGAAEQLLALGRVPIPIEQP